VESKGSPGTNRKRTNSGWVVLIGRAERKRLHESLSLYRVDAPAAGLFSQAPTGLCEFCKPQDSRDPEPPSIENVARETSAEPGAPANLASTNREHGERHEHENDGKERLGSSKFIESPEDEATFNAVQKTLQEEDPGDLR
jgi:hypothetical protein